MENADHSHHEITNNDLRQPHINITTTLEEKTCQNKKNPENENTKIPNLEL